MPKISYIAGDISRNEQSRPETLPAQMPVNYLALTRGEMQLQLMLEQAKILAGYYGDPEMKKAVSMLTGALGQGIHGMGPQHIGAASDLVRKVAKSIDMARKDIRPASRYAVPDGRNPQETGIGETIIPYEDRLKQCIEAAKGKKGFDAANALVACKRQFDIEKILNDGLENCGQYLAYGFLPNSNRMPNIAGAKIRDQRIAIEGLAQVGGFGTDLCAQWLNVGMMRKNVEVAKVQPLDWIGTNSRLTLITEKGQNEFSEFLQSKAAKTLSAVQQGARLAQIIRDNQRTGIGDPISIGFAILSAIFSLIKGISEFLQRLRAKVVTALQAAKGFGSETFGPQEGDYQDPTPQDPNGPPLQTTGSNTGLILLGGAAAALLLLNK